MSEDIEKNSDVSDDGRVKAAFGWAMFLISAAFACGVLSYCSFGHEIAAGAFMMAAAVFIGFFARERVTVIGVIIPAYAVVLFSGKFSLPAAYLGICVAVGIGAFLFRVCKPAMFIAAAIAAAVTALMHGAEGMILCAAVIPAAMILAAIYPRTTLGVATGVTALALVLLCAAFGGLFLALSPEFGIPDGISGIGDIAALLRRTIIARVSAAYAASGVEVGAGAVEQYADTVIRMLPGVVAAAAEVVAFFSVGVCGAIFRATGLEPSDFTNAEARYLVSPFGGIVYAAAALTYVIAQGGDVSVDGGGIAVVTAENIMLAMSLPLAVFAISWARTAARRAGLGALSTLVIVAAVLSVLFAGWQGVSIFAAFGTVLCIILPIYRSFRVRRGDQ